jgi:hypothetical protein
MSLLPRPLVAFIALGTLWALCTLTEPSPSPQQITDDMTAVQVNEASLGANPGDADAWRECAAHVAAYNADASAAPASIPAGLPAEMTTADACGTKPTTAKEH